MRKFTKKLGNTNNIRIYDCFQFYFEFEILKIRFEELYDIVEKFLIVESSHTHSGKPKPFYLSENLNKFKKYKNKIEILRFSNNNPNWDAIKRNNVQRAAIDLLIREVEPDPQDLIIISDADEIPNKAKLEELKELRNVNAILEMSLYIRKFNLYFGKWAQTRIISYKDFQSTQKTKRDVFIKNAIPQMRFRFSPFLRINPFFSASSTDSRIGCWIPNKKKKLAIEVIPNGGWHFTQIYDMNRIKEKIEAMSHRELVPEHKIDADFMDSTRATYGLDKDGDIVPLDNSYPKYILDNLHEFRQYIIR